MIHKDEKSIRVSLGKERKFRRAFCFAFLWEVEGETILFSFILRNRDHNVGGGIFECAASRIYPLEELPWLVTRNLFRYGCIYAGGFSMELLPQGDVLPWAEVSTQIPTPQRLSLDHTAGGVDLKPGMKESLFSLYTWKGFLLPQQCEKWPGLQQL